MKSVLRVHLGCVGRLFFDLIKFRVRMKVRVKIKVRIKVRVRVKGTGGSKVDFHFLLFLI